MTICQMPNENILLEEQRYNSTVILSTLDEFYRTITQMEAKMVALQYVSFSEMESKLNDTNRLISCTEKSIKMCRA